MSLNCALRRFLGGSVGKEPACFTGDTGDVGSVPGLVRSPPGGHCSPLQCSCLEKPTDRGAWRATGHGVTKSWTRLKRLSTVHLKMFMVVKFYVVCFAAIKTDFLKVHLFIHLKPPLPRAILYLLSQLPNVIK